MSAEAVLVGSYDYRLVVLSLLIATLASYAALDLGGRVTASTGYLRSVWLVSGAFAMGTGIWSMHYIGMLAYRLPVPVSYDWPTVLVSLLAAVVAAAVALFVVSRREMGPLSIATGGLLMGGGVAAMHYIGMEAMRLPAMCHYSTQTVVLSIVLAVAISVVALWLTFHLRTEFRSMGWRKVMSALLMGAAIPTMHYTGMAAVTFTQMDATMDLAHSIGITSLGTFGIGSISLIILVVAIVTSFVDRRFSLQSFELHLSEERYRQLVESAQVILWRSSVDLSEFSYVNHRALEMLGYPLNEWTSTRTFWIGHIHPEDRAAVKTHCAEAAHDGIAREFEHRMLDSKGAVLWLRTSVRLVHRNDHRELVGVMTDITERKKAEVAAEEASRVKSEFLAEIERLNSQLRRENSRMSGELEVTQRLQHMMLPREEDWRGVAELDISGSMEAATEVGGDYYDVIPGRESVLFGIGDVTGHGLESGVVAIMVQTAVRTLLASGDFDSQRFFEVLNRVIYDNARHMKCARNLSLSLLHYQDKIVTVSGQHEEILVVRKNGALERHDTLDLGFALGLEENISDFIGEAKIPMQSGDVMVVYTDGITEATNGNGIAYGIERLCEIVKTSHRQLADGIRKAILDSLREFIGGQQLLDDISVLVIKQA